jgi:hypothetical protein
VDCFWIRNNEIAIVLPRQTHIGALGRRLHHEVLRSIWRKGNPDEDASGLITLALSQFKRCDSASTG